MPVSGANVGSQTRRTPWLAGIVATMAILVAALLLWRSHSTSPPPVADNSVPVAIETPLRRDVAITLDANGVVTSLAQAPVRPRVDGLLVRVAFREGQFVHKGDVLAVIDPRPYEAALAGAQAAVRRDRALAADLRANLSRAQRLAKLGAGALQNAQTVQAQSDAADATSDADQALADAARLNLEFTQVTSPIDGRTGLRQIDAGTMVHSADMTPIVSVTQMSPISIVFPVPQNELDALQEAARGGAVRVTARAPDGSPRAEGLLEAIDSTVDPANGQVRLRAIFSNRDLRLWPGVLLSVGVRLKTLAGAITVSNQSVLDGRTGPYVYVVEANGRAAVRQVAIGPSVNGVTVIMQGLATGDRVVSSGQARLKAGSPVAVQRSGS